MLTTRLLRDNQSLFGRWVLTVAILGEAESKLIPRQQRVSFPEFYGLPGEGERLRQQRGVGGGPYAIGLGGAFRRPGLVRSFALLEQEAAGRFVIGVMAEPGLPGG